MGLFRRDGSPFYWMNVRRPGKRTLRKSTGVRIDGGTKYQTQKNRDLAKAILSITEGKYAGTAFGLPDPTPGVRPIVPTLEDFVDRHYEPWLLRERPDNAKYTLRRLKALFYPLFRATPLTEIRPMQIEVWRAQRLGVQKRSVNRELVYMLGVLGKAVELEVIPISPLDKLTIEWEPSPEIIRYLSADEDARLMRALAVRDAAWKSARERLNQHRIARRRTPLAVPHQFKDWLTPVVVLALHCGMRRKEIFTLQWSMVDWVAGTITVTAKTAKNKKYLRRIPMNGIVRLVLSAWRAQSTATRTDTVFVSRNGTGLTYVQTSWDAVLATARITNFRWHDLRHTFASWLVQRGERLEVVKELCGHQSLKTTQRYAHLAPSQLRDAVNRLAS